MRRLHSISWTSGLLCCLLISLPSRGAEPVEPAAFLRFSEDGNGGGRLETAAVTYRNDAGAVVRLVGAVHIGEKSYYEGLNQDFRNDDAVLYELVKPKAAVLPAPGAGPRDGGDNPISQVQHFMKDTLNLDFQLDVIDYTRPFEPAPRDGLQTRRKRMENGVGSHHPQRQTLRRRTPPQRGGEDAR